MEGASVLIEIGSLKYPLRLRGRVGRYEWQMFARGDHWVFYVEDPPFELGDPLWWLTGKIPFAEQMPPQLAIHIADACARKFETLLTTGYIPHQ